MTEERAVVVARAPARLDFGGGWTDVPPYSDEAGGTVCNLAIARYATVRVAGPGASRSTSRSSKRSVPRRKPGAKRGA